MKNVNQWRKYSNIKKFNDCCATALHEATDKFLGDEGAVIRCGGELDLIKEDPKERVQMEIARYNRNLEKLSNKYKKTEGFTETQERLNKISLTSPEESKPNG
jgi:hypothetical protein